MKTWFWHERFGLCLLLSRDQVWPPLISLAASKCRTLNTPGMSVLSDEGHSLDICSNSLVRIVHQIVRLHLVEGAVCKVVGRQFACHPVTPVQG